jgi:hypothetical protein
MRKLMVFAPILALAVAGCGSTESKSTATTAAAANPAEEEAGRRKAEAIFHNEGMNYYIGVMRPSTVRFPDECPPARHESEGKEGNAIPGHWKCAGWGLIVLEGGEGKPGECQFVEGEVTESALVGKPSGNAMTFSGSPCQLNTGLGKPGKAPPPSLVAKWTNHIQMEKQHVKESENSPSGQEQKHEEAKQEAEEAQRTKEANEAG